MAERALELLAFPDDDESRLILDIGCGSGLSGSVLEDSEHMWIGVDISKSMLDIAVEREVAGDVILGDMGEGLPFKPGTFDGAISISALQWLCNADKSYHNPHKRLLKFFTTLFSCLTRTARAVFQFYPENSDQIEMVTSQAMKAGFYGGLVVDYPNSAKAKKYYLVLMTGGSTELPKALGGSLINFKITIPLLNIPLTLRCSKVLPRKNVVLTTSRNVMPVVRHEERRRKSPEIGFWPRRNADVARDWKLVLIQSTQRASALGNFD